MSVISLDTETALIRPGRQIPPLACVSLASSAGASLVHHSDATRVVGELLDAGHTICGSNVAYDVLVLIEHDRRLWPGFRKAYESDRIRCTETNEILLDIADGKKLDRGGHSLASQAKKHLGIDLAKGEDTWRLRYGELINVPLRDWPEPARRYALDDARVTLAVDEYQQRRPDHLRDQYRQARGALPLKAMGAYGVVCDPSFVDAYEAGTQKEFARLSSVLEGAGILRAGKLIKRKATGLYEYEEGGVNQAALRARVERAYREIGEEVPHVRPKKGDAPDKEYGIAYDKLTLRKSGDPILFAQANRASLVKILGEEIPILRRGCSEPIHAWFRSLVASGRSGCFRPNLQNRANRFGAREAFVPRPGFLYSSCDYSGLEMATFAEVLVALFGRSTLAEKLRAGRDPLTEFACKLLGGIPHEEGKRRKASKKEDLEFWRKRQTSKVFYYGKPGGLGVGSLVDFAERTYSTTITIEESRRYGQEWLNEDPAFRHYFNFVDSQIRSKGFVVQLYSERVRGGIGYTDGCNTYFQGLGSDVFKESLWDIFCETLDPWSDLYGAHLVNGPHDETILEVPITRAQEAGERQADAMDRAAAKWLRHVPLRTGGACLQDHWISAAEHSREQDGSLTVWRLADVLGARAMKGLTV